MADSRKRRPYGKPRLLASAEPPDPQKALRMAELARAYLDSGQPDAATEAARTAVVNDPADLSLRQLLAQCLYRSGDFEGALAWLENVPDSAGALHLGAMIQADLGHHRRALEMLERAAELDPNDHRIALDLAAVQLEAGRAADALESIDRAPGVAAEPARTSRLKLLALTEKGEVHAALKLASEAEPELLDPSLVRTLVSLALRQNMAPARLRPIVDKAASAFRHNDDLLLAQAEITAVGARRGHLQAEEAVGQIHGLAHRARSDTARAELLVLAANLVSDTDGDPDTVEELLRQALSIEPDHPGGLLALGRLLVRRGRHAQAIEWLCRAAFALPDEPAVSEALAASLCALAEDESATRWIDFLIAGLGQKAASVMAAVIRSANHEGRMQARMEIDRELHRMKNLLAVGASRLAASGRQEAAAELRMLYDQWAESFERIRQPESRRRLVPLKDLLHQAAGEAADSLARIRMKLPPSLPPVTADSEALKQAIVNLLRNALEAAPGSPVSLSARPLRSGWVEIRVTDFGPGIPPEMHELVFEAGFTTRRGGSGMGLSIARDVVQSHGGRISLQSAEGGPTIFTVRLPAARTGIARPPSALRFAMR